MAHSKLPKEKTATPKVAVSLSQEKVQLNVSEGPLPDAASFAAYEQSTPGAGDRILRMAELEQEHRHILEDVYAQGNIEDMRREHAAISRGQWFAFLVALFTLGVSGLLVYHGHSVSGTILGGSTLGMIVASFIKSGQRVKAHHKTAQKDSS